MFTGRAQMPLGEPAASGLTRTADSRHPARAIRPELSPYPDLLSDLRDVGPNKPIGYLPLSTIGPPELIWRIAADALAKGLCGFLAGESYCFVGSGALFLYDRAAVASLIEGHLSTLTEAGLPRDPDAFVRTVANSIVDFETSPDAYRVVGLAYADRRFTGPGEWPPPGADPVIG